MLSICVEGPSLRQTVGVALVVGLALFSINQLDAVLHGQLTTAMRLRIVMQFVIPFFVSNYGIMAATRRKLRDTG